MTLGALWAFLAVALPVLAALLANLPSVDLAYHLRAGALFLDTGRVPAVDTFTFTAAGQPWLNQQWGAQALLAATYRIGGWTGLVVLRAVLTGLFAGLVFVACRRQGIDRRRAAWLTLAAFSLAAVAMGLRPQLLGVVLFAVVLLLVVERRRHPRLLWLVPLLAIAWANLHGSFFLAPALLGLAWLADLHDRHPRARLTLLAAVAAAAVTLVNPWGPSVWLYAAGLTTNAQLASRLTEWQPTTLRSVPGIAFFASALLLAAWLARRTRRTPWPALLWFAAFFAIGLWAVRGLAWWPAAAAVGFAGLAGSGFLGAGGAHVTGDQAGRRDMPRALNALLAAALVLAGIALLPVWRPTDRALGAPAGVVGSAPPGITAAIRELARPGDRLYGPQPWGSWFELAIPTVSVFADSRFELFPPGVWLDHEAIAVGRSGWTDVLDRWAVTIVVATDEAPGGLVDRLRGNDGWLEVHADGDGRVFVRSDRG